MISNRNALMLGVALAALLATSLLWRRAADVMPPRPSASRVPAQREEAQLVESESIALEPQLAERIETRAETITSDSSAIAIDVRGRVVDELKRPIVFFGLRAIHRDENNWFVEKREWPVEMHKDGEFDLLALARGRWEIVPMVAGMEVKRSIEFTKSFERRFDFVMQGVASIEGVVLDPEGRAVEGAAVLTTGGSFARTDLNGLFTLQVSSGEQMLRARAKGFASSDRVGVSVGPGDKLRGIELHLSAGATLLGTVVDENGRPVRDSKVEWTRPEQSHHGNGPEASVTTDEAGHFKIEGLEPGELALTVYRESESATDEGVYFTTAQLEDAEIKSVKLQIAPRRHVRVYGRILGEHGESVLGQLIAEPCGEHLVEHARFRADVADDGSFEVTLPTFGPFRFSVWAYDFRMREQVLDVPDRDEFEVNLELESSDRSIR